MPKYSTGELAKECDVTVRTVQYYDKRGILTPGELSEGGRRIYSEDDLKKLRLICFLRELGLKIDTIAGILAEPNSDKVLTALLGKQAAELEDDIQKMTEKLHMTQRFIKDIKSRNCISLDSMGDIAISMKGKRELSKLRRKIFFIGIPIDAVEIVTFMVGILRGMWAPFILVMIAAAGVALVLIRHYYNNVSYICPECHEVFKPAMKEFLFSSHTPKTRKLNCSKCGHRSYCIEIYDGQKR